MNSWLFLGLGALAGLFAIMQAIDGARRKRAAAMGSGQAPPTPASPAAPVPPIPPVAAAPPPPPPHAVPYHETFLDVVLAGWSPFYSFLFAVAMFGLASISTSQVPKMSVGSEQLVFYAPTPTPAPSPAAVSAAAAPPVAAPLGPTPSPTPSSTPTPIPTPRAVTCSGTLKAPASFTIGGSAIVDYYIDCHATPVLPPDVLPHMGVGAERATSYETVSRAVTGDGSTYEWQWVVSAPPASSSPEPTLDGGVDTVLYVTVTSNKAGPQPNMPGTTTPVTIRGRATFASLTAWVQGLGGFISAFVALIAGITNFVKKGGVLS
jgi:hypothetical protein